MHGQNHIKQKVMHLLATNNVSAVSSVSDLLQKYNWQKDNEFDIFLQ
jgi:hypothetical protein